MKLAKSTTILLNVALVFIMALLVKSILASPKNAYAQGSTFSYKLADIGPTQEEIQRTGRPTPTPMQVEEKINAFAQEGWRLHSVVSAGKYIAILERGN
jgi:ABC-type uncharacterized transport system permease subunit